MRTIDKLIFFLCLTIGGAVMAQQSTFECTQEKDHLPLLDPLADAWYREAVGLAKTDTIKPWGHIIALYNKAIERGHWKAMHNLAELFRTGWPGSIEKDSQKAISLYQLMINDGIPQGFYDMGAMIGNGSGIKNIATDGLNYLIKAAQLGNPSALTELGKTYIFEANQDALGLRYYQCAARQGYSEANNRLGSYYENVASNFPLALRYYQIAVSQGNARAALTLTQVFKDNSPPHKALWYTPDEAQHMLYRSLRNQLIKDPDLRFPTLMKDHPLSPHPTQGYDADRPGWKPEQ